MAALIWHPACGRGKMVKDTVLDYVKAINEHNIEKIYALMADDYMFIDTYASKVHGKDAMNRSYHRIRKCYFSGNKNIGQQELLETSSRMESCC